MLWVDKAFANRVAPTLKRFQWKSDSVASFRCPLCGDSQKNQSRTRGFFYAVADRLHFKCHNCNEAMPFGAFLKRLDDTLYREYKLEHFRERGGTSSHFVANNQPVLPTITRKLTGAPCVLDLPPDHGARLFLKRRLIPFRAWQFFYYTEHWTEWVQAQGWDVTDTMKKHPEQGVPRLVIPAFNEAKGLISAQARSLDPTTSYRLRYITAKAHDHVPKVYGLDRFDRNQTAYMVEGPFDSWFLPNCLAAMGSDLRGASARLELDPVLVFDNEPRNKEVTYQLNTAIHEGYRVVVWPEGLAEKDINDMVLAGRDVMAMVTARTFKGPRAIMEFQRWNRT
jgi:hypothetical protein